MPRPPAELQRLEDEERRRARAHRRLCWKVRRRKALWIGAVLLVLAALFFFGRLAGLPLGP